MHYSWWPWSLLWVHRPWWGLVSHSQTGEFAYTRLGGDDPHQWQKTQGIKIAGHSVLVKNPSLYTPSLAPSRWVSSSLWNSPSASISTHTHGGGVCSMRTPVWGYVLIFNYRNSMGTPAPIVPMLPTPLCIYGIQVSIYFGFAGLINNTHTFLSLIPRSRGSMENWPGIYYTRVCKQFHCIYRKIIAIVM